MLESNRPYDAIVIGSGFAGAVTACRLSEKEAGLRVLLLERGRRYQPDDFPVYPQLDRSECADAGAPDFSRAFWKLGHGLWDLRDLGGVVTAQAAGFGGGSLIYANVHLRAPADVFECWPQPYSRKTLDPYYDLAAFMLEVEPLPREVELAKTEQLEGAAARLGRATFRPPLAVNFRRSRNRFGVKQSICDLRGECCFGCKQQAKNTLDLNYLHLAEQQEITVETLAEVLAIERLGDPGEHAGYRVHYQSHVDTQARHVEACWVFLCAGAVNSTELLLRSRAAGWLAPESAELGNCYFPNADTLAVAFDCDELHEADRGPTITTALLCDRAPALAKKSAEEPGAPATAESPAPGASPWFLVQDGGIPEALEPLLGVFRSPLWLRRNRFYEPKNAGDAASAGRPPAMRPPHLGYAELPFRSLAELAASLPRQALAGVPALRNEVFAGWNWLPEQLGDALRRDRDELLDDFAALAEPWVRDFLVETSAKLGEKYPFETLLGQVLPDSDHRGVGDLRFGQQAMHLAVALAFGSEAQLARAIAKNLIDATIPDRGGISRHVFDVLRWALDYRLSESRNGILLSMGRDSKPGRLSLETAAEPEIGSTITNSSGAAGIVVGGSTRGAWALGEASGALIVAICRGEFKRNETLICDGKSLGIVRDIGEPPKPSISASIDDDRLVEQAKARVRLCVLEFDPISSQNTQRAGLDTLLQLSRIRLRVQLPNPLDSPERAEQERLFRDIAKQWGGELRTNPSSSLLGRPLTVHSQGGCAMGSVTLPNGEVAGCPGLYVMDAAAFPTSIGVNPSATIAAVAEYKVEQFIRDKLKKSEWQASQLAHARTWAKEQGCVLDPLAAAPRASAPPESAPVGIEFREVMMGELGHSKRGITTCLRARIPDLAHFLESHRRGNPEKIALEGHVHIDGEQSSEMLNVVDGSYMELMGKLPSDPGIESRKIEYQLSLTNPSDGSRHHLSGKKNLTDELGVFDVWEDSTTLRFELRGARGGARENGVLRLPAHLFFELQLPSFRATGTTDPARQSWALAAFGRFFFGHLADVYVPELDRVIDVVKSLTERSHA